MFESNIPITVSTEPTGINLPNVFASEFGSSVYSSFESMSPTLDEKHWGIHAGMPGDDCEGGFASHCKGNNPMSDRNYPCDNIIDVYFGKSNFDLYSARFRTEFCTRRVPLDPTHVCLKRADV
jgi:hypothetical protein